MKTIIRHMLCNILGWHDVKSLINAYSDGVNVITNCDRCFRRVMQDSQGNWFEASIQKDLGDGEK